MMMSFVSKRLETRGFVSQQTDFYAKSEKKTVEFSFFPVVSKGTRLSFLRHSFSRARTAVRENARRRERERRRIVVKRRRAYI